MELALAKIVASVEEQRAHQRLLDSLPKEEADAMRKQRRKQLKKREKRQRKLFVAGERALHEAGHALADLQAGDAATQLCDRAGEVPADRSGIARARRAAHGAPPVCPLCSG